MEKLCYKRLDPKILYIPQNASQYSIFLQTLSFTSLTSIFEKHLLEQIPVSFLSVL